jgi:hypothetical protein
MPVVDKGTPFKTLVTMPSAAASGRSLRLEMLQVARLSPRLLGDSSALVEQFFERQFLEDGGATNRAGKSDLYYTIFALAGLQVFQSEKNLQKRTKALAPWLANFADGNNLDFIHLSALVRCLAAAGLPRDLALLERLETFRTPDGGYDGTLGAAYGNAYGCFVALGAYQDFGVDLPDALKLVQCLKFLETPDGAWGNVRGMRELALPINASVGDWLLARQHESGGWLAAPGSPIPDLLSTATALHALSCLERPLSDFQKERCLDFVDTLWNAEGGFHGHWADDVLDAEYTFYGLLALGHLSL